MNTTQIINGNVYKVFSKYVLLSILSMLGLSFYVLADTLFIANGVGSMGLTALNLVLPMYSLVNGVGLMLGIGAATRFSILIGKGRKEHANKVFTQALYIAVSTSLFLTFMGIFFSSNELTSSQLLWGLDSHLKTGKSVATIACLLRFQLL